MEEARQDPDPITLWFEGGPYRLGIVAAAVAVLGAYGIFALIDWFAAL